MYYITIEEMNFNITKTLRASRVEKWIRAVKQRFLDAAPIKCVGLDCEFTTHEVNQRAAVLQLSVASEVLILQICWANRVLQLLKEFLKDTTIKFCGAAIANDVRMLSTYGIEIPSTYDLQKIVSNPTNKLTPSLYDLANATIGTQLENKKRIKKKDKKMDKKKYKKKGEEKEEEEDDDDELIFGWAKVPLSFKQLLYAALDARVGFEIARSYWKLKGYNSNVDHLNLNVY
jgi:ribonuclease D